jgi:hypothetical protein
MSEVENKEKQEDWLQKRWRPLMAGMYLAVCVCDFVIFPVLWSLIQVIGDGKVESQWSPITLQGAGLFHMAMGAILGIAAWGRTQEKMAGAATNTTSSISSPAPSFGSMPLGGNSVSTVPSFGSSSSSFTPAPSPSFGAAPVSNFGTKAGPPPAPMPEI